MKRREAVKLTSMLLGTSLIGSNLFLSSCGQDKEKKNLFSEKNLKLLNEIGETILPETERSPGAREADVGEFMKTYVSDCYTQKEQDIFFNGMIDIEQRSKAIYKEDFMALALDQRTELLTQLDKLAREKEKAGAIHYYALFKQLTILGYFTSEVGITKALRYDPAPGSYDGCVPYDKKQPAWYGPVSSIG